MMGNGRRNKESRDEHGSDTASIAQAGSVHVLSYTLRIRQSALVIPRSALSIYRYGSALAIRRDCRFVGQKEEDE